MYRCPQTPLLFVCDICKQYNPRTEMIVAKKQIKGKHYTRIICFKCYKREENKKCMYLRKLMPKM